jgi:hypothetical protein
MLQGYDVPERRYNSPYEISPQVTQASTNKMITYHANSRG